MSSISLSMIVRDEEETVAQALESVAPWVDELVVLDTGSRDGTVTAARKAGATVLEHPWEGFAPSRNRALDACTGAWILVLDADETLDPQSGPLIRALAGEALEVGYLVRQRNYLSDRPPGDVPVVRLFPRDPRLRFAGVLHEKITCTDGGFRFEPCEVVLHHWGAAASHDPTSAKSERYERILREALAQSPDDPELFMHLGIMLNRKNCPHEAIGMLLRSQQLAPGDASYLPVLYEAAAVCLYRLGAYDEAAVQCRKGLDLAPDFPSLLYDFALVAFQRGWWEEARHHAEEAIARAADYRGPMPFDPRIVPELAPALLAAIPPASRQPG